MIGVLSASSDANIDYVLAWLEQNNNKYIRINADEILDGNFFMDVDQKNICINNKIIPIDDINVLWYRKFGGFSKTSYYKKVEDKVSSSDKQQLSNEYNAILASIISFFKGKKWITHPWLSSVNKIDILNLAREHGISVPKTLIISKKTHLTDYDAITKSVFEPHFIPNENGFYSMFTKSIKDIDVFPENFFPSLIQEKIDKQYEIRSFYFFEKFYSMAIFSQSDNKSKEDFRKYDFSEPNKRIPYNLPSNLESKLKSMLKILGLNCCSIDIIKSISGEYIFLEINPTGEFGTVAMPCNYELYKIIAEKLIELDYE